MLDKRELEKGWKLAADNNGAQMAAFVGEAYISKVSLAIEELEKSINAYEGSKKGIAQLGGDIAEEWHAGTFNVRAAAAESIHRATVENSTEHASVDVSTNFGEDYSLKYLKYADKSVRAQAKNVIQNYHEYLSKAKANGTRNPMSFEEYIDRYGYSDDLEELLMSVYSGQGRIIPSDQLEEGLLKLRQLIATEGARGGENRLANLKNYEETLQSLCDRIKDDNGLESIPLSKEESKAIADLCRTGEFDPADFGVALDSEITREYILNQALKGGITAGVVTLAIQLVPELLELISKLAREKKIDVKQLKESGIRSLTVGTKGFLLGYISCGVYTACKAGKMGNRFADVQPGMIGTIVAMTFNVTIEAFDYARGKTNELEFKSKITKDILISGASLTGGTIALAVLPYANAISFAIGSMMGSVLASITLNASENILVSFCVNSGYTLFGLVKQDYTLSDEIMRGMGISIAELRRISPNTATLKISKINLATPSVANLNCVDVRILRRGIVDFHTIGFCV